MDVYWTSGNDFAILESKHPPADFEYQGIMKPLEQFRKDIL